MGYSLTPPPPKKDVHKAKQLRNFLSILQLSVGYSLTHNCNMYQAK